MPPARHPIGEMTADDVILTGRELWCFCPRCRVNRSLDPLALRVVGRGSRVLASLPFRCEACGCLGRPWVAGWLDGGRATWGL